MNLGHSLWTGHYRQRWKATWYPSFSFLTQSERNPRHPQRKSTRRPTAILVERGREILSSKTWNKPKGGKKGFGKGKFSSRVPASIHKLGGCSHDPDGNPICYPYNCDGCSDAADGARCKRGMHVCAKCFGLHSIVDHDKST